jgi:hypothetical protein
MCDDASVDFVLQNTRSLKLAQTHVGVNSAAEDTETSARSPTPAATLA